MPMNKTLMKVIGIAHTSLYKMSGGRLTRNMRGSEVVLLTTTGRKSGKQRTTPLFGLADGENWTVIASQGGHPEHPHWYLNLRDNPDVTLQVGSETMRMRAETAEGTERERLWKSMAEMYDGYDEYQKLTTRVIPVVVLKPAESG
ncbi:MAG: nitroreductase family deazaflavin-dependent oxidoreductase [Chloroflexi bacterium]|nr:nitroreductase family deazaflavin-dependent oxidoreductase [Chloroflexota bacterium]